MNRGTRGGGRNLQYAGTRGAGHFRQFAGAGLYELIEPVLRGMGVEVADGGTARSRVVLALG